MRSMRSPVAASVDSPVGGGAPTSSGQGRRRGHRPSRSARCTGRAGRFCGTPPRRARRARPRARGCRAPSFVLGRLAPARVDGDAAAAADGGWENRGWAMSALPCRGLPVAHCGTKMAAQRNEPPATSGGPGFKAAVAPPRSARAVPSPFRSPAPETAGVSSRSSDGPCDGADRGSGLGTRRTGHGNGVGGRPACGPAWSRKLRQFQTGSRARCPDGLDGALVMQFRRENRASSPMFGCASRRSRIGGESRRAIQLVRIVRACCQAAPTARRSR